MAELFISKRVVFPKKGMQGIFITHACKKLNYSWKKFALELGIHQRTLRSWVTEKFNMPYVSLENISKMINLPIPKDIKIFDLNEHLKSISRKGAINNFIKNKKIGGDSKYRIEKWKEWWNKEGKVKTISRSTKEISIPNKNEELAEFVGIMLGDGNISKYHISVTLNIVDDRNYSLFVIKLMKNLFNVDAKIYERKNKGVLCLYIHRRRIVNFLESIGLMIGNKIKNKVSVPDWIVSDNSFVTYCLRGLFDTDGTFYVHSYLSKRKRYSYLKIGFSNESENLINFVYNSLKKIGLYVRISPAHNFVYIESQKDVVKYINMIGTSNPKNINKIDIFRNRGRVVEGGTVLRC